MSLTHAQIHFLYEEIKPLILGSTCLSIGAISQHSFILTFERDHLTPSLFLCFQEPFLRFHLCQDLHLKNRKTVSFVEDLAEKIVGKRLIDCSLLNNDRILCLSFQDPEHYQLIAEFIPKHPNCYLLNKDQKICVALHPIQNPVYQLPLKSKLQKEKAGKESLSLLNSQASAIHYALLEAQYRFDQQKKLLQSYVEKEIKKLKKRVEERLKTLNACKEWHKVNHEGLLLQANLFRMTKGMKEVKVSDWEQEGKEHWISLDPFTAPKDIVAGYFRRSKKLRAGQIHSERLLEQAEKELSLRLKQKDTLEQITDEKSLIDYGKHEGIRATKPLHEATKSKKKEPTKPYHIFKSQADIEIWVGKNAKDNDRMTFHYAKGLDYWLHARNHPGSHVVVRCLKGQELDTESLSDAAELALRYSKAKNSHDGEVCLTQVKGLTSVKGVPGKVMLSKHKVLRHLLDDKRWQRLKNKII